MILLIVRQFFGISNKEIRAVNSRVFKSFKNLKRNLTVADKSWNIELKRKAPLCS